MYDGDSVLGSATISSATRAGAAAGSCRAAAPISLPDAPATRPWPAGAATGVGSMPGDDPVAAVQLLLGELPDLPHLPELPGRGEPAAMTGRTASLLVDLPVEIGVSGWRLAARPGRDLRRARDLLARDLDALEEATDGYSGPLKIASGRALDAGCDARTGHRAQGDHRPRRRARPH